MRPRRAFGLICGFSCLWMALATGAPRLPAADTEVLERLPIKPADGAARELRRLRAAHAAQPSAPAPASALAWRYFDLAMAEGDPRYVGYAEGVLRAWKHDRTAEILLLQALVSQYRHDFAGALQLLALALEVDSALTDARAWRAAIYMVQAQYRLALDECSALGGRASELMSIGCQASVEAATGHAGAAYSKLYTALERSPRAAAGLKLWVGTRLAEFAWRLGRYADAERHFKDALGLGQTDNYLLAAYADFLLERRRPAEVIQLLKDHERSDTLLLRLALAERATNGSRAAAHSQALAARFRDAALRGERLHLAEEARFLLELRDDPRGALAAARENWRSQKEPRDAEILLQAALAANDAEAAAPVLAWLNSSGNESVRLAALAARLQSR